MGGITCTWKSIFWPKVGWFGENWETLFHFFSFSHLHFKRTVKFFLMDESNAIKLSKIVRCELHWWSVVVLLSVPFPYLLFIVILCTYLWINVWALFPVFLRLSLQKLLSFAVLLNWHMLLHIFYPYIFSLFKYCLEKKTKFSSWFLFGFHVTVESSNSVSGGGLTLGGSRQIKLSISHFGFLPVVYWNPSGRFLFDTEMMFLVAELIPLILSLHWFLTKMQAYCLRRMGYGRVTRTWHDRNFYTWFLQKGQTHVRKVSFMKKINI